MTGLLSLRPASRACDKCRCPEGLPDFNVKVSAMPNGSPLHVTNDPTSAHRGLPWPLVLLSVLLAVAAIRCGNGGTTSEPVPDRVADASPPETTVDQGGLDETPFDQPRDSAVPPPIPALKSPTLLEPGAGLAKVIIQPAMAFGPDGKLAVVWTGSAEQNRLGISLSLFDSDGAVLIGRRQLDTWPGGIKNEPDICALAKGGYVAAWSMDSQDGSSGNLQVRFRLLTAAGDPVGKEDTRVLSDVPGNHWLVRIACTSDGGFVIAGVRTDSDGKTFGVFLWRHTAEGRPIGKAVTVNSKPEGNQTFPDIGSVDNGDLVLTWNDSLGTGSNSVERVLARVYYATSGKLGQPVVAFGGGGVQASAGRVAVEPGTGHFLVAAVIGGKAIGLKRFEPDGTSSTHVRLSEFATTPRGNASVAWLGRPSTHAIVYFLGTGSNVSLKAALLGDSVPDDTPVVLSSGSLPPYRPDIVYCSGKLAVAWTERTAGKGYKVRIALFR